ncbi:LacI family transcriptional regulator [Sinorhizobium fredii USDA 205]|uniref:Substrate-binding domain-containing protein n=1 Tax=Rhizobium fredii TaxID=380 RepID=A0A844APZ9_RHIFR|nr:LacI family DNA-binding transcriptional regulator [Sinorhizobium fredii]ASY72697.1 Transcriptional regulator, LacI family [Sinorhizobium fredii CCBAU 83666]AWM28836.1 Transcriptional regulator LacI family [Sinorhizobium fredii CCBAU 25509]KSV80823.1 LacI family transcriptional regulator [Sinorhizobium fredii USDA 205]MCG5473510.1 LacI family DNA-binding transcriptional regulator [Sinorhizobium fredii]MQW97840.1 substrate-binding domain-containing protein [Sinorhizobium fredii]
MSSRPTIADLARAAGVSVATVDRVLNGRHPVREETARRVYDAAKAIGYHAVGLLQQRVFEDLPQYRLGFLLQKPQQAFYQAVAKEMENAALALTNARVIPQIDFVANSTPAGITEKLKTMAARNQAIAFVAPDYPAVTATVEELRERGIPTFSLLSDFASGVREGYIGLNNQKVGRTAAWMIARAAKRPGKVAAFIGSHRFLGHELREIAFRSYFREKAPEFEVLDTMVNLDTAEITHEATLDLLKRHPDLLGFYVCGGGMEGAISAIREEGLVGKLLVVVNELTPESRAALADEAVIMAVATPVHTLARETINLMIGAIDRGTAGVPGQTILPFDIYTPENI